MKEVRRFVFATRPYDHALMEFAVPPIASVVTSRDVTLILYAIAGHFMRSKYKQFINSIVSENIK
jgi:hypothetical protein